MASVVNSDTASFPPALRVITEADASVLGTLAVIMIPIAKSGVSWHRISPHAASGNTTLAMPHARSTAPGASKAARSAPESSVTDIKNNTQAVVTRGSIQRVNGSTAAALPDPPSTNPRQG